MIKKKNNRIDNWLYYIQLPNRFIKSDYGKRSYPIRRREN